MTERTDRNIKALRTDYERLAVRVRGFGEADLSRPSGASEWDVSQVLSHMGSGAEISLAALDGALSGTGHPGQEFNQTVWARWDAMSPTERAEEFLRSNDTLIGRYEELDAPTREELLVDLGFMPAPVDLATVTGLRLYELTHHTWDVEVAFDPAATLSPEGTDLLIDHAGMLIGFLGKADALGGRQVTLAVRTTAPEREFGLDVRDPVALSERSVDGRHPVALVESPDRPDGVLTAPAEWWLRLVTGRHAPAHTPDSVTLASDAVTLDDLRRVFPGF
ncbi:maleylpyruvate isomerase family mycothiol-dependent enzyme [Actinoallomurus sp. CA-150999]|uniref:maleylpyruvate isomerase family mycothiol-dependent enzyme n=1 Tax=Actinoallomurus sp. CA-150999 TaxID=3239887 RepID=UPI003D8ED197